MIDPAAGIEETGLAGGRKWRIAVINNYDLRQTWAEVSAGMKPDHHLYGINYLQAWGNDIEIVRWIKTRWISVARRLLNQLRFPIPLGDLAQQASVLRRARSFDLIYSPCQTEAHLLSWLKRSGYHLPPLICLGHHPSSGGRLEAVRRPFLKRSLEGVDRFPALSKAVADEINTLTGDWKKSQVVPWGPQRNFYSPADQVGHGVVAAGRTGRDFTTFGRAATAAGVKARIFCLDSASEPQFSSFGSNVNVVFAPACSPADYRELEEPLRQARVHAIPLQSVTTLSGLTSVADAMALGRPMIITRNEYLDLDVEALGIGRFVDPADLKQWEEALKWFDTHPLESHEMGRRARKLVDDGFNSEVFAAKIFQLMSEVL